VSQLEESTPRYRQRQDYLTHFAGNDNEEWVIETPVLKSSANLTPEQAEATLDYLVSCGDRLTQMTRTYQDVEAVTRLLEEKEKDLELAANIGQELLQRNKESDERIVKLENDFESATEYITQLRHELQVKTDLLHVYTNDLEDISPLELRSCNVAALQKKISDLENDNKYLKEETSKLEHKAYAFEEKEEKLVKDSFHHLTQANSQIKDLHHQFSQKVDESSRQREEISSLLSQVCDLQNRVQRYSHENDDLTANLRVYQETQDELTTEMADLKDKYREVVELLRDANEEIKRSRKKTYPGMGKHAVENMFSLPNMQEDSGDTSLQAELQSSLRSSNMSSKYDSKIESEVSDSDTDLISAIDSSAYHKAARTYRAIANSSAGQEQGLSSDTSTALGASTFQSYTISRENSFSPDFECFEYPVKDEKKFIGDYGVSDDSVQGVNTGLSKHVFLSSSALKEKHVRELLQKATNNADRTSLEPNESCDTIFAEKQLLTVPKSSENGQKSKANSGKTSEDVEVLKVHTVEASSFHLSSSLLQSTPIGNKCVQTTPSQKVFNNTSGIETLYGRNIGGHPSLGIIPGRTFSELKAPEYVQIAGSDFDETKPLGQLTLTNLRGHPGLSASPAQQASWSVDKNETESCKDTPLSYGMQTMDFDETGYLTKTTPCLGSKGIASADSNGFSTLHDGHPGFGSLPSHSMGCPGGGYSSGDNQGLSSVSSCQEDYDINFGSLTNISENRRSQNSSVGIDLNMSWSNQDINMKGDSIHKGRFTNRLSANRSMKEEPSQFLDSGVISGDFSEDSEQRQNVSETQGNIDSLSKGCFSEMRTYSGIQLASNKESTAPNNKELESALMHLNPEEVERMRRHMVQNSSYNLGMDGIESSGTNDGCEEYMKGLPSVDTPGRSSLNSDNLLKSRNSSFLGFRNRRLPDKLRIIKPIEGSLTLHNWSKLATPHLGGVLEERCGVAIKGNDKAGLGPLFEMYQLSDLEKDEEEESVVPGVRQPTHSYNTLTNSMVLHPDISLSTNSYGGTRMSSGVPSRMCTRPHSRMSSRASSFTDLPGLFADSNFSNIGLSKLLNEKNLSGARRSQLDLTAMSSISSLTPSVLTSPNASKNISPTGTPLHTPEESLPGSPNKSSNSGVVYSFFSSLKAAIYGEQRREHRSSKFKRRMDDRRQNLCIMEADEKVGIEHIFKDKEGSPMSGLSDFDARYLGVLDDFDELEDITPGCLTLDKSTDLLRDSTKYTKLWIGEFNVPSISATGRPSLKNKDLGKIPFSHQNLKPSIEQINVGGRGPGRIVSPGEARPNQIAGLGVPCQPGTGALSQAKGFKRDDLGTIPGIKNNENQEEYFHREISQSSGFIGSFRSILFGRKGGY